MAKASRWFAGNDTFGRSVERAQRADDGRWFSRVYEDNGYGKAWSRWTESDEPTFETHGVNAYTGDRFEHDKPRCKWGFHDMVEIDAPLRIRLPNV